MAEFSSATSAPGQTSMLAAGVRKPGGPDAVALLQMPMPAASKGQVLIEIHAGIRRQSVGCRSCC